MAKDEEMNGPAFGEDNWDSREGNSRSSAEYQDFRRQYAQVSKKETMIQVIGGIFIIATLLIEFLVFRMAKRLQLLANPPLVQRFTAMFFLLFTITALAALQFLIILNWNRAVSNRELSLTAINYQIVGKIKVIQAISLLILIVGVFFIALSIPFVKMKPLNTAFPRMALLYRFLIRTSDGLLLMLMAGEIVQFGRWERRTRAFHKVESAMLHDFPDLNQIVSMEWEDSSSFLGDKISKNNSINSEEEKNEGSESDPLKHT